MNYYELTHDSFCQQMPICEQVHSSSMPKLNSI